LISFFDHFGGSWWISWGCWVILWCY